MERSAAAYNAILARQSSRLQIPRSFAAHRCVSQPSSPPPYSAATAEDLTICVYARPGWCSAVQDRPDLNEWLLRNDQ